jgi:transposase
VLTLPASVRIYVAAEAVDLRRGFDGLAAATRSLIGEDPLICVRHEYAAADRQSRSERVLSRSNR